MDFLSRVASNPFFPFLIERVEAGIRDPKPKAQAGTPGPAKHYGKSQQPDADEVESYRPTYEECEAAGTPITEDLNGVTPVPVG